MVEYKSEELARAELLMYQAKFDEALGVIESYEKEESCSQKNRLKSLILKGRIYVYKGTGGTIRIGEEAYQLSQELGMISESIEAILLKANIVFINRLDEALELILKAEKMLKTVSGEDPPTSSRQKADVLLLKSWYYFFKNDFNSALVCALKGLSLLEKLDVKINIAYALYAVGYNYIFLGNLDEALEYSTKSLALQEELGNPRGIAQSICLVGYVYDMKGDFGKATKYLKQSLSIKEIDTITKINANFYLGNISLKKGELDMALKNFKQSASISEEINDTYNLGNSLMWAGYVYRLQRKPELAIEYLERSLKLSEKYQYPALYMCLQTLVETHVDNKSRQQAEIYLEQLKKLTIQKSVAKNQYLFAKAYFLKSSKRMRDFTKAEKILREFIWDNDSLLSLYHTGSMILLCDLLLKELLVFNNPEVLDEINKLITRLLNVSEKEHSFWWLAETKLLQAKLTLIRLDIEGAKRLLVQAQRIAELHEIYNLAQRISRAHDRLLDQEEIWNKLKQIDAPMSERINLASFDGVISRLQGKHSGEPTNIPPEDPICLLIIEEGGILVFSHFFSEKLSFEDDLVSNFLIAFNSFSEEVFSKGLDRAKFGEYTLIMQSVGFFSVCYLFEGQSYLAMQKLTRFADKMQNHNSIWQKFKDFQKTHQIITLKNNPLLERAIFDIFLIES